MKRIIKKQPGLRAILPFLMFAFIIMPLAGHDMWVETGDIMVKPGKIITMKFPSDHAFPAHHNEYIKKEDMAATFLLTPSGRKINIRKSRKDSYCCTRPLREKGTHLIVSGKKWLYWTQTTDGWKPGKSKIQVKNPLKGVYSGKFVKSLVNVSQPGGRIFSKRIGHDLEIIPVTNPAMVKPGDSLVCKILFKGRPYKGEVKATYSGYSKKENTFAVITRTDSRGLCRIKLSHKGPWLIKAGLRLPAAERQKRLCDELLYSATLTFTR